MIPDWQGFANAILKDWPELGELDPGDVQDLAIRHGLLIGSEKVTPCEENCWCAEYHGEGETVTCYRRVTENTPEGP